jgi:CheY-like chemotaxis protein
MRGKPFEPGNTIGKGRPRGSRNKRTVFQEALESHGLQAISQLKLLAFRPNPDMTALQLYVVRTAADLPEALSALTQAVSRGRLSAQEGEAVARIIEGQRHTFEAGEFDKRLRALEQGGQEIPLKPIEPIPDQDDEDP